MDFLRENAWALAGALGMDLLLGDREAWPHPARWMGAAYLSFEKNLRMPWGYGHGIFALTVVAGLAALGPALVLHFIPSVPARTAAQAFLFYWCLSVRGLSDEVRGVARALESKGWARARRNLARIVGRDTGRLSASEISRAAIETTGESFVDGFLSPVFWGLLGGAPGAFFFKAVSTGDSMIGHPEAPYRKFGWAAARLDDVLNFIPARLSPVVLVPAAWAAGLSGRGLWMNFWSDRLKHQSPNAAHGEAAFAGALGVRLGGVNRYGGKPHRQPFLNAGGRPCVPKDLSRALRLLWAAAGVVWAALLTGAWGFP